MDLTHQFSIQISHYAFFSPLHGFLAAKDPLRADDAIAMGLTPVLVYRLECSRSRNRVVQVCRQDRPIDPLGFMLQSATRSSIASTP